MKFSLHGKALLLLLYLTQSLSYFKLQLRFYLFWEVFPVSSAHSPTASYTPTVHLLITLHCNSQSSTFSPQHDKRQGFVTSTSSAPGHA